MRLTLPRPGLRGPDQRGTAQRNSNSRAVGLGSLALPGLVLLLSFAVLPAAAGLPRVVADIPPIHALVAQVMGEVGEPALLTAPGASPHGHALRPSEAAALQQADLVVWVGPALTPWLERALETLGSDAASLPLLSVPGTHLLPLREGPRAGNANDAAATADPHAWLDPANAQAWLAAIAAALGEADPEHAATYAAHAEEAAATLERLSQDIAVRLAPADGRSFLVQHDAFRYFEARFGLEALAAISGADGAAPGPQHLAEVVEAGRAGSARCLLAEAGAATGHAELAAAGSGLRIIVADPLGATLAPGPELYRALLEALADAYLDCLS